MTTLRELIDQAVADMDRLKHPDTAEAERCIDEILVAGKLGSLAHEHLEGMHFHDGMLLVDTSYSVRGCSQSSRYEIPETVIDGDDPVAAIKPWAKEQRVAKARDDLAASERQTEWYRGQLAKAEAEAV